MSYSSRLLIAAVAAAAALPSVAQADDAYICDGGRMVYARPETLEKLKASDPCVAAYWRLNEAASPASEPAPATGPQTLAGPPAAKPAGKPVQRPNLRDALTGPDPATGPRAKPAATTPTAKSTDRPAPPASAANTDFRNVRVINAEDGPEFYRHDR
jgi:hypothetical protein